MPRIDFKLWDRVYILKLICTAQMTYSSFVTLVYFYLIILQSWTCWESERPDVLKYKWSVIGVSVLEFGLGTLLAFAANMPGIRGRQQIIVWLVLETFLVPVSIGLLMQLYYRIVKSTLHYTTDPHYARVNIAQVCLLLCQYIFITYALNFLVYTEKKPKMYDPSIRPESVYAPTDPQITTTESRHIRLSQSFLFQPSSSKKVTMTEFRDDVGSSSSSSETKITPEEETEMRSNEEWNRERQNEQSRNQKEFSEGEKWMKDDGIICTVSEENNETIPNLNSEQVGEKEWREDEVEEWTGNVERDDYEERRKQKNKHIKYTV